MNKNRGLSVLDGKELKELRSVLRAELALVAAYLFGSYA